MRTRETRFGRILAGPAAALLVTTMVLVGGGPAQAGSEIATVGDMTGYVAMEREEKTYRLATGVPLYTGDMIKTGGEGKTRLLLKDDSVVSIGPETEFRLEKLEIREDGGRSFSFEALVGRFKVHVAKWFLGGSNGIIATPTATAGVRGTVVWGDTELDAICALEGEVELKPRKSPENARQMTTGDCYTNLEAGKPKALEPSPEQLKAYLDQVTID